MTPPLVVKLGGSLAKGRDLDAWLDAIAGGRRPLVIVPGGGPFADAVRTAQLALGFSHSAAHAMAIQAMEQFAEVILDKQPAFARARLVAEMLDAAMNARTAVWLPTSMALNASDIPASWDITSDSLAAWLAGRLGARQLLLIKSSDDFGANETLSELSSRGIIDAAMPLMMPANISLHLAGPRHLADAGVMLAAGNIPGIAIGANPLRKAG